MREIINSRLPVKKQLKVERRTEAVYGLFDSRMCCFGQGWSSFMTF